MSSIPRNSTQNSMRTIKTVERFGSTGAHLMPKYRVLSGEFQVILEESTLRRAGDLAISLHDKSNHPSKLGELTLVEKLDRHSNPTGDHVFISTQNLLKANTAGVGEDCGQYSRPQTEEGNDD